MMLRPQDVATLDALGLHYTVQAEGNHTCVVIADYPLPNGLQPRLVELLLRLPKGFPDAAPDMFWVSAKITCGATGEVPAATDVSETHVGREWKRWSRHLKRQWRSGTDDVRTYLAYIQQCLEHESRVAA